SQNSRKALEVVDSNLCKGTDAAIVIPGSPSGTGIPIQSASAVNPANCTLVNPPPKGSKGRCQLYKWRAHQVQRTILRDPAQVFGFAARGRSRLFDNHVLSLFQSESHQRAVTFWWRNDKHNIHARLHDFGWIHDQFQAWASRFKFWPAFFA